VIGATMIALITAACGGVDEQPVDELCNDDAPLVSWETFGQGFVTTYCQGCHASTTPNRQGAPENVIFDTEADVLTSKDRVLATTASESPTMPPNGGPSDADRAKLELWLTCFTQ